MDVTLSWCVRFGNVWWSRMAHLAHCGRLSAHRVAFETLCPLGRMLNWVAAALLNWDIHDCKNVGFKYEIIGSSTLQSNIDFNRNNLLSKLYNISLSSRHQISGLFNISPFPNMRVNILLLNSSELLSFPKSTETSRLSLYILDSVRPTYNCVPERARTPVGQESWLCAFREHLAQELELCWCVCFKHACWCLQCVGSHLRPLAHSAEC